MRISGTEPSNDFKKYLLRHLHVTKNNWEDLATPLLTLCRGVILKETYFDLLYFLRINAVFFLNRGVFLRAFILACIFCLFVAYTCIYILLG